MLGLGDLNGVIVGTPLGTGLGNGGGAVWGIVGGVVPGRSGLGAVGAGVPSLFMTGGSTSTIT